MQLPTLRLWFTVQFSPLRFRLWPGAGGWLVHEFLLRFKMQGAPVKKQIFLEKNIKLWTMSSSAASSNILRFKWSKERVVSLLNMRYDPETLTGKAFLACRNNKDVTKAWSRLRVVFNEVNECTIGPEPLELRSWNPKQTNWRQSIECVFRNFNAQ